MFWKKKENTVHVLTLGVGSYCDAKAAAMGSAGGPGLYASSGVHEEIERQVKRRFANEKFGQEFAAAPAYRIRESYDVKTHKDTYHLEQKQQQYNYGFRIDPQSPDFQLVYVPVFSSENKADVTARFDRVMPKKVARKKAA